MRLKDGEALLNFLWKETAIAWTVGKGRQKLYYPTEPEDFDEWWEQ